jgi:PPOX class probable F420-dependent enzyme
MADIPIRFRDLLADETKTFMCLATTMPDGTPQVTPVWFNYDGTHIWVNSARGRVKDRNMSARPHVACLIVDPNNPYRFLQARGEVVAITKAGADDHIRDLAAKYTGQREFEIGDDRRVIYKIRPDRFSSMG